MTRSHLTGSKVSLSAFTRASDALDKGSYRDLKLAEHAKTILVGRIVNGHMKRQVVSVDDSQIGFVPGRGNTDALAT